MRQLRTEAEMTLGVEVKPASAITTWRDWPEDVRGLLEAWNSGPPDAFPKLSFYRRGLFNCTGCKARCEPATNGVVYLNKRWLCDDCLIVHARAYIERRDLLRAAWRGGGTMRRRSGRLSEEEGKGQ